MNQPEKKPVTLQHYAEVAESHMKDQVILPLEGWEIALLHGVICVASSVDGVEQLSETAQLAIRRWRDFCLNVMVSWGFTPEEMAWLDEATAGDFVEVDAANPSGSQSYIIISQESRDRLTQHDSTAKYPSGIGRIDRGECPRGMQHGSSCVFCPYGHMLECHYPKTCKEAQCSHETHITN